MFGNLNQCNPVKGGSQIYYDYLYSILVKEMCPKIETEYRIDCGRYDEKTYKALNFFLEKGYVAKSKKKNGKYFTTTKRIFNPLTKPYRNISYFNKTRKVINKECC